MDGDIWILYAMMIFSLALLPFLCYGAYVLNAFIT